ncbi:hypothetical protein [Agrobacterium sp.]|uniref:hypothetical protein n=1 Tax=Agrobacterium sp. TaxID=361 RepID=UPI0028A12C28|nr:hypothetical protein [Agrobacterium sp.]
MPIFEINLGNPAPAASASIWVTILTGLAVAVGAGVVMFLLNWAREVIMARRHKNDEAAVLAFSIASQIDNFINSCYQVVAHGVYYDDEGGMMDGAKGPIKISFSEKHQWTVFDRTLQHRIRSLPNKLEVADAVLDSIWDQEWSDLEDILPKRAELYAEIGLEALDINAILHKKYGVPLLDRKTTDPASTFSKLLESFAESRERHANGPCEQDMEESAELLPPPSIGELNVRFAAFKVALDVALKRHDFTM